MLGGDWTDGTMTDFKWRHFQGDVILWAVRWYCRYPISYRDLEEMLAERGISVDHTTIRSEEHTSELQSLMRISYAVFCLKKKKTKPSDTIKNSQTFSTEDTSPHYKATQAAMCK